jgi:ATP-dependent RNA helicase DeaD
MHTLPFDSLGLLPNLVQAMADLGYEEATPIQTAAIPLLLEGKDMLAQSRTGTGKTLAFGLPTLQQVKSELRAVQALVMCPTRELALQVSAELQQGCKHLKGVSILAVYGGQPLDRQIRALQRGPQIVVGTPGRILDHLSRQTLHLDKVQHVILDEADEMLNMGFIEDIEAILSKTPDTRQTICFSATLPPGVVKLTERYLRSPERVQTIQGALTVPLISQYRLEVRENDKLEVLARLIDAHQIRRGLVFANQKSRVDELVAQLQARGYSADALHGDMRQGTRETVMSKFRTGTIELLIATDVAARGLDIDDVEAVFNYDLPLDEEYYVHRIGRTGRAGRSGKAFSMVTRRDFRRMREIESYTRMPLERIAIPSFAEVQEGRVQGLLNELRPLMDEPEALSAGRELVETLVSEEGWDALDLAAALLQHQLDLDPNETDKLSSPEATPSGKGMVRLFLNAGKRDRVRPADIVGAIAGESGLPGKRIGEISLFDNYSFVEVPAEAVDQVLSSLEGIRFKGRKLHMERAEAPQKGYEPGKASKTAPAQKPYFGKAASEYKAAPKTEAASAAKVTGPVENEASIHEHVAEIEAATHIAHEVEIAPMMATPVIENVVVAEQPSENHEVSEVKAAPIQPRARTAEDNTIDNFIVQANPANFGRERKSSAAKAFGQFSDKKSYGEDGDRKPFKKNYGDSKPYGAKSYDDDKPFKKSYGDAKPYGAKSYGDDKPYKKSYGDDKPYAAKPYGGDKPFKKYGDDKPSYGGGKSYGSDKPYKKSYGDDKPYGAKSYGGDKPFKKYGDDKPSYGGGKSYGSDKPYKKSYGDDKPYGAKSYGGDKPFKKYGDNKPAYGKSYGSDKPYKKADGDDSAWTWKTKGKSGGPKKGFQPDYLKGTPFGSSSEGGRKSFAGGGAPKRKEKKNDGKLKRLTSIQKDRRSGPPNPNKLRKIGRKGK